MGRVVFLFLWLMGGIHPAKAMKTERYQFLFSCYQNKAMVIDRKTKAQTLVTLGGAPFSMAVYDQYGFVLQSRSSTICVLDLTTDTCTWSYSFDDRREPLHLFGGFPIYPRRGLASSSPSTTNVPYNEVTYVLNSETNLITVIDSATKQPKKTIDLREHFAHTVFYKDFMYRVNAVEGRVEVTDSRTSEVTYLPVGRNSSSMICHKDKGYVLNRDTHSISVFNLEKKTLEQTLYYKSFAEKVFRPYIPNLCLVIDGDFGYLASAWYYKIMVIDLQTGKRVANITAYNEENLNLSFSDTHLCLGLVPFMPKYPTKELLREFTIDGSLRRYKSLLPQVFHLGCIPDLPDFQEVSYLDALSPYVLVNEIAPWLDPLDQLSLLVALKEPKNITDSVLGKMMVENLYVELLKALWVGNKRVARKMIVNFVYLEDPHITSLVKVQIVRDAPVLCFLSEIVSLYPEYCLLVIILFLGYGLNMIVIA